MSAKTDIIFTITGEISVGFDQYWFTCVGVSEYKVTGFIFQQREL